MIKGILLFVTTMMFLLLICMLIFTNMGIFLVADHNLVKVDSIVVLMGGPTTKVPEAADLFLEGYAKDIIMAQTPHESMEPDPETGLLDEGETERSRLILIDFGVPDDAIIIIPSMTNSTRDEAEAVKDHIAQNKDIHSIILVTSNYHTRRAFIAFSRALRTLDRNIILISRASRHSNPFQAKGWWCDEQTARLVVLEYLKIANYYFLELFNVELVDLIDNEYFLGID